MRFAIPRAEHEENLEKVEKAIEATKHTNGHDGKPLVKDYRRPVMYENEFKMDN